MRTTLQPSRDFHRQLIHLDKNSTLTQKGHHLLAETKLVRMLSGTLDRATHGAEVLWKGPGSCRSSPWTMAPYNHCPGRQAWRLLTLVQKWDSFSYRERRNKKEKQGLYIIQDICILYIFSQWFLQFSVKIFESLSWKYILNLEPVNALVTWPNDS